MKRLWKCTRNLVIALVVIAALAVAAVLILLHHLATAPLAPEPDWPLLDWQQPLPEAPATPADWEQRALADRSALFKPEIFAAPPREYGPWTRWWWPGNVVDADELVREMRIFAAQGFGGVEIQSIGADVSDTDKADSRWGESGWDSPAFYANVRAVLDAADELDMRVDITAGSGWPSGGPHIGLHDGMQSLVHGERIVSGPATYRDAPPPPVMPVHWRVLSWLNLFMPMGFFAPDHASLLTVVASRVVENSRSANPLDIRDQVSLEPGSGITLDAYLDEQGELRWQVPEGEWAITAFYRVPGGETGMAALPRATYVVDHFDGDRLNAHYNYLFRPETGLSDYYGRPLRAIFNDSFEFKEERLWPKDQFAFFEQRFGYDPRTQLQAIVQTGHDFSMFHWAKVEATHEYSLGDRGKRFEYDWEQGVSEAFIERFIDGSRRWAEAHGLASRTQAYGFEFDLIKAAGHTSIPETEQQGGSMLFMKVPSSGAWLYGRPLVTAESFIHKRRAWMSTPAKVKAQAQQLFAAGVNQLVYHGSPYQVQNPQARGYIADGWYPFATSSFSEDFSEQHPHWLQLAEVNTYIARQQYLLRLGEPEVDVLVYYPWLGFPLEGIGEDAFLVAGQFDGEPSVSNETPIAVPLPVGYEDPREQWLASLFPVLQDLESRGLTWQWINPEKAVELEVDGDDLRLGDARYRGLLLHDVPAMPSGLAEQLISLEEIATPAARLAPGPVAYPGQGIQQLRRRLTNGDLLIYLNNTGRESRRLVVELQEELPAVSVLDAWTGTTWPLQAQGGELALELPGYGARVLLASAEPLADTRSAAEQYLARAELMAATKPGAWRLEAEGFSAQLDALMDWREVAELADLGAQAIYHSEVTVDVIHGGRYVLDLGEVFGVAHLGINGHFVGTLSVVPFSMDVTDYLQAGTNAIEIRLVPPRRNAQVQEVVAAASGSAAMRPSTDRSAAGLLGPVRLQHWE
jgi:alpha-L-rhamnosidase